MKTLYTFLLICMLTFLFASCSKEESPQTVANFTLIDKTPAEIRANVSGTWQIQRETQLTFWDGGSGISEKTWLHNTGHIVRFLPNDTLNMSNATTHQTYVYEKATIERVKNTIPNNDLDSVNAYLFPTYGNKWLMREFKNDTLVFYDIYPEHIIVTYFATRKK